MTTTIATRQPLTAKDVKPKKQLDGISQRQIDEHFDVLYKGYVNKYNEIQSKMETANPAEANGTYSPIRELKLEETFAADAVRLHEWYFENLGGDGQCRGEIMDMINQDFGSYQQWEAEFRALGVAARGWVVLAFDWTTHRLHNFLQDAHNIGAIWQASPILILDTYEHAYFIDYGTNRKGYLEAFMKNINWDVCNQRLQHWQIAEKRA